MLRTIFVLALASVGVFYAVQGPFYALLFYLWYAYFRPDLWAWSGLVQSWNPSMYLGVWVVALTLFSRHRLKFDLHVALMLLFVLQAFISAQLSDHISSGMISSRNLATRLVITYLIAVLLVDTSKYRLALQVMALSIAFEGAKQGWAQMVSRPGEPHMTPMPFLGDNNAVAIGMLMLIPILGVLAQTTERRWARFGYLFLLIGVFYRALATYSRGGLLAAGALALTYWWRSKRKLRSMLLVIFLGGSVLAIMPDAFWQRMRTTFTFQEQADESALGRLHFWAVALDMANDRPLVGLGPDSFSREYLNYDSSFGRSGVEREAHSAWFGVLAEQGYPGAALYVSILVLAFVNCRQVRYRVREGLAPAELAHYSAAVEVGLIAFVVGSSFLSLPEMEMPYHFVGLSMALKGLALDPQKSGGSDRPRGEIVHSGRSRA